MIQEVRQWKKLKGGHLKCNMDAPILHNVGKTSCETVVRNFQGAFVTGLTDYFEYTVDSTFTKILSL